jgi:hypothetical protein
MSAGVVLRDIETDVFGNHAIVGSFEAREVGGLESGSNVVV